MAAKKPEEQSSSSSSEEEISEQEEQEVKPTQKEKSSSEEEESEEEESSSDEAEQILAKPNPKPQIEANGSKSESESESESESDGSASASAYKLQPIPKVTTTAAKRTLEEITENSPKSTKKAKIEEKKSAPSTPKSGSVPRMWSNDDEITLLNGVFQFKKSKGAEADLGGFYDDFKGKLSVDYSRDQLISKVSRLKKKFANDVKRGKDGSDPVFSKPHELKVFKISKKIWGDEGWKIKGCSNGKVSNGVQKETKEIVEATEKIEFDEKDGEEGVIWSKYPFFSGSFAKIGQKFPSLGSCNALKEQLSLVGSSKAKELDDKWKEILMEETELHYKMMNLMRGQVKLGLEINEGEN